MNRLFAVSLTAVLAAVLAGCGGGEEKKPVSGKPLPSASEMFDKKEVPKNTKGAGSD
jgi:hypothetical protein